MHSFSNSDLKKDTSGGDIWVIDDEHTIYSAIDRHKEEEKKGEMCQME